MIDKIGVEVRIERIWEIKGGSEERGKMAVVRLGSEGEKRRTMEKKKDQKEDKGWIVDDLMWKERKEKWHIAEIAKEQERRRIRVPGGNGMLILSEDYLIQPLV